MVKLKHNLEFFSKNLRYLIKKNNIKNVELADFLGMSKSAISNYITGVSVPKLETVVKIASYFDVNFEKLISQKIDEAEIAFNEEGKLLYNIPLFHKQLATDSVIYRSENYVGIITSPVPVEEDLECYALKAYDDSMKSFGIVSKSLVIFSAATEVSDNDIAAVLIKSKKQLSIRSVKCFDKKIELISDNGKETFKITKKGCDAVVLGKVVSATFFPNKE
ncbi:MAG: helix-turn-helix domain-containing protein [Clostridia bacterium]|nr:helix-turn-helix domain-containing protein [Clostridia bacterium]